MKGEEHHSIVNTSSGDCRPWNNERTLPAARLHSRGTVRPRRWRQKSHCSRHSVAEFVFQLSGVGVLSGPVFCAQNESFKFALYYSRSKYASWHRTRKLLNKIAVGFFHMEESLSQYFQLCRVVWRETDRRTDGFTLTGKRHTTLGTKETDPRDSHTPCGRRGFQLRDITHSIRDDYRPPTSHSEQGPLGSEGITCFSHGEASC